MTQIGAIYIRIHSVLARLIYVLIRFKWSTIATATTIIDAHIVERSRLYRDRLAGDHLLAQRLLMNILLQLIVKLLLLLLLLLLHVGLRLHCLEFLLLLLLHMLLLLLLFELFFQLGGFLLLLAYVQNVGRATSYLKYDRAARGRMFHQNGQRTRVVFEDVLFGLGAVLFALFLARSDYLCGAKREYKKLMTCASVFLFVG